MTYADAILLQENTAKKVLSTTDDFGDIRRVCGVDIAYSSSNAAYGSAVIMDRNMQQLVESIDISQSISQSIV